MYTVQPYQLVTYQCPSHLRIAMPLTNALCPVSSARATPRDNGFAQFIDQTFQPLYFSVCLDLSEGTQLCLLCVCPYLTGQCVLHGSLRAHALAEGTQLCLLYVCPYLTGFSQPSFLTSKQDTQTAPAMTGARHATRDPTGPLTWRVTAPIGLGHLLRSEHRITAGVSLKGIARHEAWLAMT